MTTYPIPVLKPDYSDPALSIKKSIGTYYFINLKLVVIPMPFVHSHPP
jgi:hypothetical protein